jgi:hypothetical protein
MIMAAAIALVAPLAAATVTTPAQTAALPVTEIAPGIFVHNGVQWFEQVRHDVLLPSGRAGSGSQKAGETVLQPS